VCGSHTLLTTANAIAVYFSYGSNLKVSKDYHAGFSSKMLSEYGESLWLQSKGNHVVNQPMKSSNWDVKSSGILKHSCLVTTNTLSRLNWPDSIRIREIFSYIGASI
jgi:hypothetical protein